MLRLIKKMTYAELIIAGFALIILLGSLLLSLPIATNDGRGASYFDALFTSVSATCVTGLVVQDTATYWSGFGQAVILCLIQIGGLGVMTLVSLVIVGFRRSLSLHSRVLMTQASGLANQGSAVSMVRKIVVGSVLFELAGAILLSIRFIPLFGLGKGIYYSIFHSISAFCNAGFDLMGTYSGQFSSLTAFSGDWLVSMTACALILIGGLGFVVWDDIMVCRFRWKRFQMYTKLVLVLDLTLVVAGSVLFFLFDNSHAFAESPLGGKICDSIFHAVTPRTAGFNTVSFDSMSGSGYLITVLFMMIGGCSGSTAGGLKVSTVFVLLLCAVAASRKQSSLNVFKGRLDENVLRQAAAICTIYVSLICVSMAILSAVEPFGLKKLLFDCVSALSTVGLSMGITPMLSVVSRIVLILLMFTGRVGIMTVALITAEKREIVPMTRPVKQIMIG